MSQSYLKFIILLLVSVHSLSYGQEESTSMQLVNTGVFSVRPETVVATRFDFVNTTAGNFVNDGSLIFYKNFKNDGSFGLTTGMKTSSTHFILNKETQAKQIYGAGLTSLYDVEFDSELEGVAFDLKNNLDIYGLADFKNGIVKVDPTKTGEKSLPIGMMSFMPSAQHTNVGDHSFVDGEVEKIGRDYFEFPIGKDVYYRPAFISAPDHISAAILSQYYIDDASFFKERKNAVGVIEVLNEKEYWRVHGKSAEENSIILSLTWDDRTTPKELLKDPEGELHIVRWDEKQHLWVDEGGVVDMSTKKVTTPATIKNYGYFTLATVKKDWIIDGDVVIYNLVTPDGDGKNDYFIIENIKKFPNNKVEIYNRWGVKVYETTGYDPYGDGSTNVFTGYSGGKITVDKSKKLPSGTYYYVVTYEYTDAHGSRMIKKAANLHLETN
ncbi:gliding motility-associated C-terminal domain-containing protein [Myroides sp. WP-1]|uniref:gliding motility-associated C-terminal domain-containing protein n=1 Tax=Myroides sp. WP-1 TaxID=2759944 RepID=UPI0015FBFA2C|nr:gliding motility-associated C-terminal domain-containing protein [Myroides sp. WP-1]MBB1140443.1 gliding motility-associated C-terminal domain-containing protein [Myroides sp. WP-1]